MNKLLIVCLISLGNFLLFGQAVKLDSLLVVLEKCKSDTSKIMTLISLSKSELEMRNYEEARKYADSALALSLKIRFPKGAAAAFSEIGYIFKEQSVYGKALDFHFKSLKINEVLKNKKAVARNYYGIGQAYYWLANYPLAYEYYQKALKANEALGNGAAVASGLRNLGWVSHRMGEEKAAIIFFERALKISENLMDTSGNANSYHGMGLAYNDLGNYDKALESDFKALLLNREMGDKVFVARCLNAIGMAYHTMGKSTNAIIYADSALNMAKDLKMFGMVADVNLNKAKYFISLQKLPEAYRSLQNCIQISMELDLKSLMSESYKLLAFIEADKKHFEKAYNSYILYKETEDSIYNLEKSKKIDNLEMQYLFDKKEAAIKAEQDKKNALSDKEMQKQKLVRNGFIGGFAVVLIFAGVFFTQRNKIKKGKQRSDELLLNILPSEVAEELKAKGNSDAKLIDEATVLFTDFKGFTQLSEKLPPKELVAEINTCFSAFDYIMQRHGVEKIKTIGDAYMAAGGLPTPNKTHAEDVIKAALEIQDFMHRHKAEKEAEGKLFFEIRIGVHTGPVVAGIVGIKKFAYDIWGDTVNTASRMESSGEVGKVNISGTTYELVKDKFNCINRGKILAKGKGEIDMYFADGKI